MVDFASWGDLTVDGFIGEDMGADALLADADLTVGVLWEAGMAPARSGPNPAPAILKPDLAEESSRQNWLYDPAFGYRNV